MNRVCCLVGGQYGSEGKGAVAGHIAKQYDVHVRVGAANAGHTVYTFAGHRQDAGPPDPLWDKHVLQQIPCAAYANPHAVLCIGPGAQISPQIFVDELWANHEWRRKHGIPAATVLLDPRAHVIQPQHIEDEGQSGLAERIGSTSTIAREGIGTAQAARVMREDSCIPVAEYDWLGHYTHLPRDTEGPGCIIKNVPEFLAQPHISGNPLRILLEGTQGAGLSLTTGSFPYVTSRNTTAAGLCADAGIPPTAVERVILVLRTFPIRVAGNSGPFYGDSREIDWRMIGVDPDKERTTVTKKVRRVATFSDLQAHEAAYLNGATEVALTFADYIDPEIRGVSGSWGHWGGTDVGAFVDRVEHATKVPVTMIGTGPYTIIERDEMDRWTDLAEPPAAA